MYVRRVEAAPSLTELDEPWPIGKQEWDKLIRRLIFAIDKIN